MAASGLYGVCVCGGGIEDGSGCNGNLNIDSEYRCTHSDQPPGSNVQHSNPLFTLSGTAQLDTTRLSTPWLGTARHDAQLYSSYLVGALSPTAWLLPQLLFSMVSPAPRCL